MYAQWVYMIYRCILVKLKNILKIGDAIEGFIPDWIGKFYAYYQWFYNIQSAIFAKKIPVDFLTTAYHGLHDSDVDLAVMKVGAMRWKLYVSIIQMRRMDILAIGFIQILQFIM